MAGIDISDYKSQYGLLIAIGLFAIGFFTPYYLFFLSHQPLSILNSSEEFVDGKNASLIFNCGCASGDLNQSVIAYSFFGTDNYQITSYFLNLKENIDDRIPKSYKGWRVRLYVNSTSSNDPSFRFLQDHFRSYSYVDICNATKALESQGFDLNFVPMTWRFLPLLDPTVTRMISRDVNSLVTDCEVSAVNAWIKSGTTFHVMKDHCIPILNGIWAANLKRDRKEIVKTVFDLFNESRYDNISNQDYGLERILLSEHIWPMGDSNDSPLDNEILKDSYM